MKKTELGTRTMSGKAFRVTDTDYGPVIIRDYEPTPQEVTIDLDYAKAMLEKDDPRYAKYFDRMSDQDIIKAYRHITKQ